MNARINKSPDPDYNYISNSKKRKSFQDDSNDSSQEYEDKYLPKRYNNNNKNYNSYEDEEEDEYDDKYYDNIRSQNYNRASSYNNYPARNSLEEIEEKASYEEESSSIQRKFKFFSKNRDKILALRKIYKYGNDLFWFFEKWKKMTNGLLISTSFKRTRGSLKKHLKNYFDDNNYYEKNKKKTYNIIKEYYNKTNYSKEKIIRILSNLKCLIELGHNKKKSKEKFFDLWYDSMLYKKNNYYNKKESEDYLYYSDKDGKKKSSSKTYQKNKESKLYYGNDNYKIKKTLTVGNGKLKQIAKRYEIYDSNNNSDDSSSYNNNYSNKNFINKKRNSYNNNDIFNNKKTLNKKIKNPKLLYILKKYIFDKRYLFVYFNKWIEYISGIYVYDGEEAYNDFEQNKNNHYYQDDSSEVRNNKITRKNKINKVQKYIDDYESDTPNGNDNSYNYNNNYNKNNNQKIYKNSYEETDNAYNESKNTSKMEEDNQKQLYENDDYMTFNVKDPNEEDSKNNSLKKVEKRRNTPQFLLTSIEREDINLSSKVENEEYNSRLYEVNQETVENEPVKILKYKKYNVNKEPDIKNYITKVKNPKERDVFEYNTTLITQPLNREEKVTSKTKVFREHIIKSEDEFGSSDEELIKNAKPKLIVRDDGTKMLEYNISMPEKSIITHKKTTKINDANYTSDRNMTNNTVSNYSRISDVNYSIEVPNIDNIILLHDVNKKERYLNLNLQKNRFNANNFPFSKNLKKLLVNLIKKNECRNNKKMNCFDIWFDQTYKNENYMPYARNEVTYEYNDDSNFLNTSNKQLYNANNFPTNKKIRLSYNYSNTNKNYVDENIDNKKRRSEFDNFENNNNKKFVEESLGNIDNVNNENYSSKNDKNLLKKSKSIDQSPPLINKTNYKEKINKSDIDIESDKDPEFENLTITQDDNNINNNNRNFTKKEKRLVKKYKKALHLLRKAIRSFKKRQKLNGYTLNDLQSYFKKWLNITFINGLIEYRKNKSLVFSIEENPELSKNNEKSKKDIAENRLLREVQLKNIIDFLTDKKEKIQAEKELDDKSWSFYKWYNRIYSSDEEELDNYLKNKKKKDKITPGYTESNEKKQESDNKQNNISNNQNSSNKIKKPIIIESKNPIIIQNISKKKYYEESESNSNNFDGENNHDKFIKKIDISNNSKNEENLKIKNNNINAISLESNQYDLSEEQNEQTDENNENTFGKKQPIDLNNSNNNNLNKNQEKSSSENNSKNFSNIKNKNIIVISNTQNSKHKQNYHKIKSNYDDIAQNINYINSPNTETIIIKNDIPKTLPTPKKLIIKEEESNNNSTDKQISDMKNSVNSEDDFAKFSSNYGLPISKIRDINEEKEKMKKINNDKKAKDKKKKLSNSYHQIKIMAPLDNNLNNQEENKNSIITIFDAVKPRSSVSPPPQKVTTKTVIVENESKNLINKQKNEKSNSKNINETNNNIKPKKTKQNENINNKINLAASNDANNDLVNYNYNSDLKKQKKTTNAKSHKQITLSSEESSSMLEDPSSMFTINNQDKKPRLSDINENPPVPIEEVDDSKSEIINGSIVNINKEEISYPNVYKYTLQNNKVLSYTMNLLKNTNNIIYKNLHTQEYVNLLEKNCKVLTAYHIFCLYCMFESGNKYYKLKFAFNKWRNVINIFKDKIKNKHMHKNYGHCLNCDCGENSKKCPGCSCNEKISMCYNCSCKLSKIKLKKILFRHIFMKVINSKRYYLFLWFKNTFNKIRKISI